MPDFNKGDFTQQGVAGHVNANLRLNEKRLVNIDLTSNEEAEGCTITGTVKDLLNDKVYGIGSGVSGNIEITENGENINVAPYATATVNVSGDTLLKTTLTLINETDNTVTPSMSLYGYRVIPHQFNSELSNKLYTNLDEGNQPYIIIHDEGVDNLAMSIPAGATVSYDFYYLTVYDSVNIGFMPPTGSNPTATNMTYIADPGIWAVTDAEENSSLTLTFAK